MIEGSNDPDHLEGNGQGSNQGLGWEAGTQSPDDEDLTCERQADRDQYLLTFEAMHRIGVSVGQLWLYYLSMGGNINEYEVDSYLHGLTHLPALDRDMISQAVNEMIDDICRGPRAPYSAGRSNNTPYLDPAARLDAGVNAGTDAGMDMVLNARLEAYMSAVLAAGSNYWDPAEDDGVLPGVEAGPGITSEEPLLSVVYSSAAVQSFTDANLAGLLTSSRRTNQSCHLTGLLLYRQGRFLQVLEGPEATVRDRMAIISADPRHTRLRVLVEETTTERQFPDWTMGYAPISPDMSEEIPGYEKTFTDEDDDVDPGDTLRVLRDFIRWFQDRAIPLR